MELVMDEKAGRSVEEQAVKLAEGEGEELQEP